MKYEPDRVLAYIIGFKRHHGGNSPTYQVIAGHFGCSNSVIYYIVSKLAAAGRVKRTKHGFEIPGGKWTIET